MSMTDKRILKQFTEGALMTLPGSEFHARRLSPKNVTTKQYRKRYSERTGLCKIEKYAQTRMRGRDGAELGQSHEVN